MSPRAPSSRVVVLLLLALASASSLARAQQPAVAPVPAFTWQVLEENGVLVLRAEGADGGIVRVSRDLGATVTVRCLAPVDCSRLRLAAEAPRAVSFQARDARSAGLLVRKDFTGQAGLAFVHGTRPVSGEIPLVLAAPTDVAAAPAPSATPAGAAPVGAAPASTRSGAVPRDRGTAEPTDAELLSLACPLPELPDADFVLDALGNVLQYPSRTLTERDAVRIAVVGDRRILGRVRLVRASATRPFVATSTLGVNVPIPPEFVRQSAVEADCGVRSLVLGDFAPGAGRVAYSLYTAAGTSTALQQLEFKVNPLYTGALALGAIRTNAGNPTYGPTFNGRDTVVSERDGAGDRVLWVLTYTPFIWGARDVSVAPRRLHERVTPLVGVVLNDVRNNAIAGITVDLGFRLYLSWGVHAARVQRIDPRSGLAVGSIANNRGPTVPTVRDWIFRSFYGLSFDVQAAVDLLRTAMGVAKP